MITIILTTFSSTISTESNWK